MICRRFPPRPGSNLFGFTEARSFFIIVRCLYDQRGLNDKGEYDRIGTGSCRMSGCRGALTQEGHEVNCSWGTGVHSHNMGGAMLPEMMRWVGRDQPVSVDPHDSVEHSFRTKK
jgi:hypothetical protein